MKPKYQPSLYVAREPGEAPREFHARILARTDLLPDQRTSLQQDNGGPFDACVQGIWIERPPLLGPANPA